MEGGLEGVNSQYIAVAQKERLWTTALYVLISSGPALLVGCTLGFPSAALLDLDLDSEQSDLFGVSLIVRLGMSS